MEVLLHNKPRKANVKTSKSKVFAMAMPMSMLMLIFPNGPGKLQEAI